MTPARTGSFYGYYLSALAFCLALTSGSVYLYSRGVLVRDQIVDFDASRTEISLAFTIVHAVNLAFAPVLGYLVDRFPLRNVIAGGTLWLGCGFLVMSQAQDVWQFAAVTATFVGLGIGALGTTANAKLMVSWFDRRRGLALGIAIAGYSVAGIVAAPAALVLLEGVGWRATYALFGAFCLLVVLPAVLGLVKQGPVEATPRVGRRKEAARPPVRSPSIHVYLSFLRSPPFWGIVLVFGLADGVFGGLNLHLFLHFTELGVPDHHAALILSWSAALALVSKPAFGALADRAGERVAALVAMLACVAAMLSLATSSALSSLLVAGGLFGLAFGGMLPLRAAVLSRVFEPGRFGRAYGSFRLCLLPITLVWTPLIGLIYDETGSYLPVFELLALAFAAAAAVAFVLIPRPAETAQEPAGLVPAESRRGDSSSRGGSDHGG